MATQFTCFPNLPPELRREIWKLCHPSRVVELNVPIKSVQRGSCFKRHTSKLNAKQPAFVRASAEAHDVATEGGECLRWKEQEYDRLSYLNPITVVTNLWFSPENDVVHMNWDPLWRVDPMSERHPIRMLLASTKLIKRVSITDKLVLEFEPQIQRVGRPKWVDHKGFGLLGCRQDWIVCIKTIDIHTSPDKVVQSGLFGGLDERIQLVDPLDHGRIRRLYELCQRGPPEDIISRELFRDLLDMASFQRRVDQWKEEIENVWLWHTWLVDYHADNLDGVGVAPEDIWIGPRIDREGNPVSQLRPIHIEWPQHRFNKDHAWVRGILEAMPSFRPMIMFRYCSERCYSVM